MKAENVKKGSKKFVNEFKEFISKGNVLDLAVGVIIGGAFTSIVNSLVNDMFMPVIGGILSGINFTDLKVVIPAAIEGMADVTICYGSFIQAIVNFLLTALVVFLFIKGIAKLRFKKEEEAPKEEPKEEPKPSDEVLLLRDILAEMKKANGEVVEEAEEATAQ